MKLSGPQDALVIAPLLSGPQDTLDDRLAPLLFCDILTCNCVPVMWPQMPQSGLWLHRCKTRKHVICGDA